MKTCPACSRSNNSDAGFCIFCGFSLALVPNAISRDIPSVPLAPSRPQGRGTVPALPASGALQDRPSSPAMPAGPSHDASAVPFAAGPFAGDLKPGQVVDGKYHIERVLGEGGMGVVYLASDINTQINVVVKAIRSEYAHTKEFRDRILDEGRALARIDHPNVVRLNAVVVEPAALYLVMQFIEGESLDVTIERHVKMGVPLPIQEGLRIFRQVLQGVGAAHQVGVIHRDLKPANILVRARDGIAKVTDFGIAKPEEDAKAGRGQTKGIIGSLLYMAPEQVSGRRDIDKRVDIYALGILLFEMLVGRVPFDAPSEFEIMKLHLEGAMPRITSLRNDAPTFLDVVIERACAKNRDQRYKSCDEFAAVLEQGTAASVVQNVATAYGSPPIAHTVASPAAMVAGAISGRAEPAATAYGPPVGPIMGGALGSHPMQVPTNLGLANRHGQTGPAVSQSVHRPAQAKNGLMIAAAGFVAVLVLGGAAIGGLWSLGWLDSEPSASSSGTARVTRPPTNAHASGQATSPAHDGPLKILIGAWKSDTNRIYDAVMSGDIVEFRIRDARQFPGNGYVNGEARFSLGIIPGETATFAVEDKIRPNPPVGIPYDLSRARPTCQEVWSTANGRPLRAEFDGTRLTVDMAKVEPSPKMFEIVDGKVVGCLGLREARASKIESTYTRVQ